MTLSRFNNWRTGMIVSLEAPNGDLILGTAVVITRQADREKFYKVHLASGPRAGLADWATEGWILGRGKRVLVCSGCYGSFRSNDPTEVICETCVKETRRSGDFQQPTTNVGRPGPKLRRFR